MLWLSLRLKCLSERVTNTGWDNRVLTFVAPASALLSFRLAFALHADFCFLLVSLSLSPSLSPSLSCSLFVCLCVCLFVCLSSPLPVPLFRSHQADSFFSSFLYPESRSHLLHLRAQVGDIYNYLHIILGTSGIRSAQYRQRRAFQPTAALLDSLLWLPSNPSCHL